jgi:hypothetical protein
MSTHDSTKIREVLRMIADDMAADARTFDGKPFSGRTVGEYFGNHGAAIARLAEIVAGLLLPADEPERDPVPLKDFLPEPIPAERVQDIVNKLNWFIVILAQDGGTDYNLDQATNWALALSEVSTVCGPDGDSADIELTDGTVIVFSRDVARWEIAVDDLPDAIDDKCPRCGPVCICRLKATIRSAP